MRRSNVIALLFAGAAAIVLGACGGDVSTTGGGSTSSGASSGTGGAASSSSSASSAGAGAGTTTSSSSSSSSGGGHDGGSGALAPSIAGVDMFVDCMPIVGPDPVHGTFQALYDNTQGSAGGSATVQSARLLFDGSTADSWTFTVTPNGSGPVGAGQSATVTHTKDSGSGKGSKGPCSFCGGSHTWTLEVTWDVGGGTVTQQASPSPVMCAF
jgi:hypothetical protein